MSKEIQLVVLIVALIILGITIWYSKRSIDKLNDEDNEEFKWTKELTDGED